MTSTNHALTGALIGLSVANPWFALPLAFLSHYACDAIPHYDMDELDEAKRIHSREFLVTYLLIPGSLCVLLVLWLASARPHHWLVAAVAAFLATSPDLLWLPRFIHVRRTGKDMPVRSWYQRLHAALQWKTGPKLWWVEAVWAIGCISILMTKI